MMDFESSLPFPVPPTASRSIVDDSVPKLTAKADPKLQQVEEPPPDDPTKYLRPIHHRPGTVVHTRPELDDLPVAKIPPRANTYLAPKFISLQEPLHDDTAFALLLEWLLIMYSKTLYPSLVKRKYSEFTAKFTHEKEILYTYYREWMATHDQPNSTVGWVTKWAISTRWLQEYLRVPDLLCANKIDSPFTLGRAIGCMAPVFASGLFRLNHVSMTVEVATDRGDPISGLFVGVKPVSVGSTYTFLVKPHGKVGKGQCGLYQVPARVLDVVFASPTTQSYVLWPATPTRLRLVS